MKKLLLLLTSFVLTGTMMARQLTPDEALALAMGKMNAAQPERAIARGAGANAARPSLTHTEMTEQEVPLYYVYNFTEGGFLIASADDRVSSLLGYTDSGDFEDAKQNLSFIAWLKDCRLALSHIDGMSAQTRSASAGTRALIAPVKPLLGGIEWNQRDPYNLLTPMRGGKRDENAEPDTVHAPTGCVATAIAQVMKYYQWPVTGTGSHTNMNDSTQTVDFTQSTYEWSKMPPAYKGGESEESRMAVARLMYDLGCALDMGYDYKGSGAADPAVLSALGNHFGYDKSMRLLYRTECSSEEWNELLLTELYEERPVLFGAMAGSGGGHEFVIDGCDVNGLYHVNWGWGGMANGYFDLNLMDPIYQGTGGFEGGYTIGQVMVLGVRPDVAGTSVAKPEPVMTRHFMFDDMTQQWSYLISNYGLGDFTGETGVAMEAPTGEITKVTNFKSDASSMVFYQTREYTFDAPVAPGPGYKLYVYYSEEMGGEMKRILAPYSSFNTLYSVERNDGYIWSCDESETAHIDLVSVELKHYFAGFAPQLNVILTNDAASVKEYVEDIYVNITTMVNDSVKNVCSGYAQAFISPGETKEIAVKCNLETEQFKGKIVEGEYMYHLAFFMGGHYYDVDSAYFKMVTAPPSEITYSDFAINKIGFHPGEELTASMTVANDGGFDVKTLAFKIHSQRTDSLVTTISLRDVDIETNSCETYTFRKVLNLDPGVYKGTFYVKDTRLEEAPTLRFAVGYPTDLDKLLPEPAHDGSSVIYDLQGRPVQQMRKGSLYIGKDKVIVK